MGGRGMPRDEEKGGELRGEDLDLDVVKKCKKRM